MPMSILLIEDHSIVRQGVRMILEREGFQVVGEAADGFEGARLAEKLGPDLAVVDLAMPTLNGIDTCRELHRVSPRTKAIVLSMYREDRYVLEALRAGTRGYVLKTQAASDLGQAIREVARGGIYLSPGVSRAVVEAYLAKTELPPEPLSPRERQVLQLVAEGKSTKEVAAVLGISVKTAESHRGRLMSRLDIHDTAGLVRYAIRHGLIQP
jgi:two-component system, NarL family, response regulator NreC